MEPRGSSCLDAETWCRSLAWLAAWSATDAPIENALRISRHLAMLAPPQFRLLVHCPPDEIAFDELLERRAFEAAAVALVGTALHYEIVARDNAAEPTVRLWRDEDGETFASADTLALALMRAWAAFMLAQATGSSHKPA